ncbi:MAG: phosphocholine cytidylyltransferase family protein [Firmicutes bacterium]|nr:phosphocholine cytidylyltransferase family protein [Bacillota bacterium]
MSESPTAIILAAGLSSRLRPLTDDLPKCLLPMGHRTILDWQLLALQAIGVHDVVIVVGYRAETIIAHTRREWPQLRVTFVENTDFQSTNTLFSLACALRQHPCADFYYFNADVVFHKDVLHRLDTHPGEALLATDRKQCREEEVKLLQQDGRIAHIGKDLDPALCLGEFIGVARFRRAFARAFSETVLELATAGNEREYFELALDRLAAKHDLVPVDVTGIPCIEVDFVEDYEYAISYVVTHFS